MARRNPTAPWLGDVEVGGGSGPASELRGDAAHDDELDAVADECAEQLCLKYPFTGSLRDWAAWRA
jgi:hypothetical protein